MPDFSHPQQVRDMLAATIGEEVFNEIERQAPMHTAGNPPPPPPQADPAPAAPAPKPAAQAPPAAPQPAPAAPAPKADPSQAAAPAAPAPADSTPKPAGQPEGRRDLLLGKYEDTPEGRRLAAESYHRLLHANKELLRRLETAEGKPLPLTPTSVQPEPAKAPREDRVARYKAFAEKYNVDPEDIADLIRSESREAVKEELKPRDAFAEADSYMASKYPESVQLRDELVQFCQADPDTAAVVAKAWELGDYKGALEIGWNRFEIARHAAAAGQRAADETTERQLLANEAVRQEEVAKARVDAGLISSQVSGVHETTGKQFGPSAEERAELERLYRAGHKEPWLRAMIGSTLPDELFGTES